jgi:tRNA(Leu) C34 or U34 (ribose-2'-O)-methylase TrmL
MRGFFAIALLRPKSPENIGGVLRAAGCYGAHFVAIEGDRTMSTKGIRHKTNTQKAELHMPVMRGDLRVLRPFDCAAIAIDLVDDALPLPSFEHPMRAFYIFGPEDGTLGPSVLSWCEHRVVVPTRYCMNLAACVNVVLYDRLAKQGMRAA